LTRWKREDMAEQHNLLVVDAPAKAIGIAAVVPGAGFDRIARELGADVTIPVPAGANPSVRDLLVGVNASLASTVYLLPNDPNVALAAREVGALSAKTVVVVPSPDPVAGLAMLLRLGGAEEAVPLDELTPALDDVRSASVFFAGKDASVNGVAVQKGAPSASIGKRLLTAPSLGEVIGDAAAALGADGGGLVTLYYGGSQRERDAQKYAALLGERFSAVDVEYYYGGQPSVEYWISVER
jgi:dihydroxyacetone kinase-like predicted kinase